MFSTSSLGSSFKRSSRSSSSSAAATSEVSVSRRSEESCESSPWPPGKPPGAVIPRAVRRARTSQQSNVLLSPRQVVWEVLGQSPDEQSMMDLSEGGFCHNSTPSTRLVSRETRGRCDEAVVAHLLA
ncbi:hypothetical protein Pcinc_026728 [Petrolisthes cinctipes]|uniref:Uncharacterized protein n=1 Tax=Petrolisthes cinctipes TaxID=88211 RepID=A0AAE1F5I8_PETCI|nr:hypothetical protein Pcinc_026728 [Petrolisthes cinctipes]